MLTIRYFALVALIIGVTPIATAENYVIPSGVTVLTEEQLLNQIVGNTFLGGERWAEYHERPTSGQMEGKIKGWHKVYGNYTGKWTINKALMCWKYDKAYVTAFSSCFTTALKENIVTRYKTDGTAYYPRTGSTKLVSGNPKNL